MAFPDSATLRDDFNRANETPLTAAQWSRTDGTTGGLGVQTNQCYPGTTNYVFMHHNVATFGPDVEVWFDVPLRGTAITGDYTPIVMARLAGVGSATTWDGYFIRFLTGSTPPRAEIIRMDNGTGTQLGANITITTADGDAVGLSVVGSTIEGWHKPSAGAWTSLGARTDATYTAAGYVGLYGTGDSTTWRIDNFNAGTVGATATPMRSLMGVGLGVRLIAASQLRESLSRRKLFKLVGALLYRK